MSLAWAGVTPRPNDPNRPRLGLLAAESVMVGPTYRPPVAIPGLVMERAITHCRRGDVRRHRYRTPWRCRVSRPELTVGAWHEGAHHKVRPGRHGSDDGGSCPRRSSSGG